MQDNLVPVGIIQIIDVHHEIYKVPQENLLSQILIYQSLTLRDSIFTTPIVLNWNCGPTHIFIVINNSILIHQRVKRI